MGLFYGLGLGVLSVSAGCEHQENGASQNLEDSDRWVRIFEPPERDHWQRPDEVVKMLRLKPGDVVADIGAGTGYFTRRIAAAVGPDGRALGLDVEPRMVEYMKKDAAKLGLDRYQARLVKPNDPRLPAESVDLLFLCNAYHGLVSRVEYLRKLVPVLKPGGRVVIVDFYKRDLPAGPHAQEKLSREQVEREAEEAGYRLIRSESFLPYQYFLEFEPV